MTKRLQHKPREKGVTLLETLAALFILIASITSGFFLLNLIQRGITRDRVASDMIALSKAGEAYVQAHWSFLRDMQPQTVLSAADLRGSLPDNRWVFVSGDYDFQILSRDEILGFLSTRTNIQSAPCPNSATCGECLRTPLGGHYVVAIAKLHAETSANLSRIFVGVFTVANISSANPLSYWNALGREIYGRLPFTPSRPASAADDPAHFAFINQINYPCNSGMRNSGYVSWASFVSPVRLAKTIKLPDL